MTKEPLSIVFEFARTDTPENPYAFHYGHQDYALRTTHGGRKRVSLDWSAEFLHDLDALHQPRCDPAVAQRIGRAMCQFLEPSGWTWHAQAIASAAQNATPIIVTIRSAAAELYTLPWELLPLESTGQCVGEIPGLLVRYEWPETHTVPAKHVSSQRGSRVLVAWSAAAGSVPASEHVQAIQSSWRAAGGEFVDDRDVIAHASAGKLADALERAQRDGEAIAALHILCHGGHAGKTWGLMLNGEDADDDGVAVDAWRLRQLLAPHAGTLRLVVVMACGSAYGREFDSVAQALHRTGIQSVVASRFPLSVPGSIRVAETLYSAMLVQRRSLESSFLQVRRILARDATRLDWAGLQLYARQADGMHSQPVKVASSREKSGVQKPSPESLPDFASYDLGALLGLQKRLASSITTRFETQHAIVCLELADLDCRLTTQAPKLQELCRGMFLNVALPVQGHIFETRSDRLWACFPSVRIAIKAIFKFLDEITEHNYQAHREEQLITRIGLHYGPVLSNGKMVTGPNVDIAAQIVDTADNGEILWSQSAFEQAPRITQAHSHVVSTLQMEGSIPALAIYRLPWREVRGLPNSVYIEETGQEIPLPKQDIISFGRLDNLPGGTCANDVVLVHEDESVQLAISRWHFELRRLKEGYVLRSLSKQLTEVNGEAVKANKIVRIHTGTMVRLARVLTLHFRGPTQTSSARATVTVRGSASVVQT